MPLNGKADGAAGQVTLIPKLTVECCKPSERKIVSVGIFLLVFVLYLQCNRLKRACLTRESEQLNS